MMNHPGTSMNESNVQKSRSSQLKLLPEDYEPDNWTVICGRGKTAFNHYGNRRLRVLCEMNEDVYEQARSKTEKSVIVLQIMDAVRKSSSCNGFVKQDPYTSEWFEVSDDFAREKIGQQLRENLSKKKKTTVSKKSLKAFNEATPQALKKAPTHLGPIGTDIYIPRPTPRPIKVRSVTVTSQDPAPVLSKSSSTDVGVKQFSEQQQDGGHYRVSPNFVVDDTIWDPIPLGEDDLSDDLSSNVDCFSLGFEQIGV